MVNQTWLCVKISMIKDRLARSDCAPVGAPWSEGGLYMPYVSGVQAGCELDSCTPANALNLCIMLGCLAADCRLIGHGTAAGAPTTNAHFEDSGRGGL